MPSLHFRNALPLAHTLSLCLSAILLSSPQYLFDIKPLSDLFSLTLIIIKSSDKHRCFTWRANHNTYHFPGPGGLNKDPTVWLHGDWPTHNYQLLTCVFDELNNLTKSFPMSGDLASCRIFSHLATLQLVMSISSKSPHPCTSWPLDHLVLQLKTSILAPSKCTNQETAWSL